jgi:O-methyltransferase involved in polyketide biosynthesis
VTDDVGDSARPHPGRMYDYVIGGSHNLEVDRVAADQFVKLVPSIPAAARQNRAFLKVAAERWERDGIRHILDLGSGLPTQGHLNDYLPEAQILFTDNDVRTVEYGQQILGDNPAHEYLQADVFQTGLLEHVIDRAFKDHRRLGVGFIGLSYFASDDQIRNLSRELSSSCAPGSVLAMTFLFTASVETAESLVSQYARVINAPLYLRSPDDTPSLLFPWQVEKLQLVEQFTHEDRAAPEAHESLRMYGLLASIP